MDTFLTSNHNNDCILKWRWFILLFSGHWTVLSGLLFTIAVGVTMFHKITHSNSLYVLGFWNSIKQGKLLKYGHYVLNSSITTTECAGSPELETLCCKGRMVGSQFCPVWSGSTVVKSYLGKLRQPTFLSENIVDIAYNVGQYHIILFLNMIIYTIRKHGLCK